MGTWGHCSQAGRHPEASDEGVLQGKVWEAAPVGGERTEDGTTNEVRGFPHHFILFNAHLELHCCYCNP